MDVVRQLLLALACLMVTTPALRAQRGGAQYPTSPDLIGLIAAVRHADFRGDLDRLQAIVGQLDPFTRKPALARAAFYWRGYAHWRRALNGANEANASMETVDQDFAAATREFKSALAIDSTYLEAQIGAAAGLMARGHFRRSSNPSVARELWRQAQVFLDAVERRDPHNPRLLFITAGRVYWTPPVYGGDQQRAVEMVERGLERVRGAPPPSDPLEPGWGEAELHMLAAFFHANRAVPDLVTAERHARAALAAHPEWHYVNDILLPQIAARSNFLDFLVGSWVTADTSLPVGGQPGGTSSGLVIYRWGVEHAWLLYDFKTTLPGFGNYSVHGATRQMDSTASKYHAVVLNNIGSALQYEGAWADDSTLVFEMTGGPTGKRARVTYVRTTKGEVRLISQRAAGTAPYETYFVTRLTRVARGR